MSYAYLVRSHHQRWTRPLIASLHNTGAPTVPSTRRMAATQFSPPMKRKKSSYDSVNTRKVKKIIQNQQDVAEILNAFSKTFWESEYGPEHLSCKDKKKREAVLGYAKGNIKLDSLRQNLTTEELRKIYFSDGVRIDEIELLNPRKGQSQRFLKRLGGFCVSLKDEVPSLLKILDAKLLNIPTPTYDGKTSSAVRRFDGTPDNGTVRHKICEACSLSGACGGIPGGLTNESDTLMKKTTYEANRVLVDNADKEVNEMLHKISTKELGLKGLSINKFVQRWVGMFTNGRTASQQAHMDMSFFYDDYLPEEYQEPPNQKADLQPVPPHVQHECNNALFFPPNPLESELAPYPWLAKLPEECNGKFASWFAFVPTHEHGCYLQVWYNNETRYLLHIPYGTLLLLPTTTVHSGTFQTHVAGNPRLQFYGYLYGGNPSKLNNNYYDPRTSVLFSKTCNRDDKKVLSQHRLLFQNIIDNKK